MSFTLLCACWFSCCFSKCQPRKHVTLIRWFTFNLFRFSCFLVLLLILIKLFIVLQKNPVHLHCVKRVQIRSFFWSVFSCIRNRKNSVFGHLTQCYTIFCWSWDYWKCRLSLFQNFMILWSSDHQYVLNKLVLMKSPFPSQLTALVELSWSFSKSELFHSFAIV